MSIEKRKKDIKDRLAKKEASSACMSPLGPTRASSRALIRKPQTQQKSQYEQIANTGPVDTPGEIAYQYYSDGPVRSEGKMKVKYGNPGPVDTDYERSYKNPIRNIKNADKSDEKNDTMTSTPTPKPR